MSSRDEYIRECRRNFLGHINAEPDNLFLRSQYADWLEEEVAQTNGDADAVHARLIRAQIGLAGFYCGPGRTEEERQRAMERMRLGELAAMKEAVGLVFPPGWIVPHHGCGWDRGFVTWLALTSGELIGSAWALERHLISRLRLLDWYGVERSLPREVRESMPFLKRLDLPATFIDGVWPDFSRDISGHLPGVDLFVHVGSGVYIPAADYTSDRNTLMDTLERLRTQVLRQQGVPEGVIDRWANEAVPHPPPE